MKTEHAVAARRLNAVSVKKLFGVFDHRIELNNEERITIIHGPNGFGKTAILRLVAGFFERRYSMLRNVPFESVSFEVSNLPPICVTQARIKQNANSAYPKLEIKSGKDDWSTTSRLNSRSPAGLSKYLDERRIPWLHQIDENLWFDNQTGEQLDIEEVVDRYQDILPIPPQSNNTPEWLQKIQDSVQVYLIRANRLESPTHPDQQRMSRTRAYTPAPAVAMYAKELSERIQRVQTVYAGLSQTLDRSFPMRIMTKTDAEKLSLSEIKEQLAALDQQRKELNEAGLLEQEAQAGFEKLPEPDENQRGVLTAYIDDMTQKINVFRDLHARIKLFRELLNSRFRYKQVRIDKRQGLVFQTDTEQELPPTSLSTGEQHEVVILYQLLFLTKQNSLVLIDEPEISLHVAWQQSFLKDILKISELSKIDFLIATHSPSIINDRWDLTVELKGPQR
jgi:predicted ATP-binding protein involved in virulence